MLGALWDLVWAGEVTNDTLEPLRSSLSAARTERRGRPAPRPARLGPRGSEGRWSLRRSRWEKVPSSTERATAIAKAMLERYGIVLREAPHAEGLPGGFANVYDVYRALEDQGRVRRGYFVAERGALQFALPGAEERLRTKRPEDEEPRTLLLAATDPANPWGSLLPWPMVEGRSPQRTPGARVILHDGQLLAWVSRGGQNIATFLPTVEPAATHAGEALANALVMMARRRGRAAMLVTLDGAPAPESPYAKMLASHGFVSRRGALVYIPPMPKNEPARRGDLSAQIARPGVVSFERTPGMMATAASLVPAYAIGDPSFDEEIDVLDEDEEEELSSDLAEIGATSIDLDLPPDEEHA